MRKNEYVLYSKQEFMEIYREISSDKGLLTALVDMQTKAGINERKAYETANELIGEVVWDTKTNLYKRMNAECGACEDKMRLARLAKEENLDAVHDTVHEMAKDEARHGKGFEGLYKRYFGK